MKWLSINKFRPDWDADYLIFSPTAGNWELARLAAQNGPGKFAFLTTSLETRTDVTHYAKINLPEADNF